MLEIEPDAYFYLKPKSADSPSQGTSASVADVSSSLQPPPEAILPDAVGAVSKNMYLSAAYFPWFIIEGDEDAKFYATTHEKTSCFCITWEDLNMKLSKNGIQVSQETPYRDFTPDEKTIARLGIGKKTGILNMQHFVNELIQCFGIQCDGPHDLFCHTNC